MTTSGPPAERTPPRVLAFLRPGEPVRSLERPARAGAGGEDDGNARRELLDLPSHGLRHVSSAEGADDHGVVRLVDQAQQPAGLIEHGLDQGDAGPPLRCGSGECRRPWESSEKDGGSFAYAADGSRVR